MSIQLQPRLKPTIGIKEILAAILPSKKSVAMFEDKFAKKFGSDYSVMFQHGRSGLYALFKSLDIENKEIICPAYTCVVVPHAIVLSGNTPVFIDCGENNPNMDYNKIENAINENTRAIMVTHLFGYPMDVHKINDIKNRAEQKYNNKILIIQDVAHSFGAKWNGELVTGFGDVALFGLNISKTITSVFGGMITTNNQFIYEKLYQYRNTNCIRKGIKKWIVRFSYLIAVYFAFNNYIFKFVDWLARSKLLDRFTQYYKEDTIDLPSDWNYYPSGIEASVGLIQLKRYDQIIKKRTGNALQWMEKYKNHTIKFFPHSDGATYSHCVGLVENRDEWIKAFRKKGIQLGILIEYSIPYMEAYKDYKNGEYPVSKYYSGHTVNFPVWPGVKIK
jgi:dTDP-4-amino-4,6-dideoxygalactose transaminase